MYGNGYGMNPYMPYQQNGGAMNDVLTQYKGPYQGQFSMNQQAPSMMPQPMGAAPRGNGNEMIWVQGEAGAKAYLVAPRATVVLWDTEKPTIYVKSADENGKPLEMRVLDFTERGAEVKGSKEGEHECTCGKEFVRLEDFNQLKAKYEKLEGVVLDLLKEKEKENG